MSNPSSSAKPEDYVTIGTIAGAVAAVAAAIAVFKPKLAVVHGMKRQIGKLELDFRIFYSWPLFLNLLLVSVLWLLLVAGLAQYVSPQLLAHYSLAQEMAALLVPRNMLWFLLAAVAIGVYVKFNVLNWILLVLAQVLSMLPIPGLHSRYGLRGRSAGWLQAFWVCSQWDTGHPLLIRNQAIEPLANRILAVLSKVRASREDFAEKPEGIDKSTAANIALFGCIVEATHGLNKWHAPQWSVFYKALSDINKDTKLFEPDVLAGLDSGGAFARKLRDELTKAMLDVVPDVVDHKYLAIAEPVATAWSVLKGHKGSTLALIPWWASFFGGQMFWLDRRLAQMPRLQGDGMRAQLIKLLLRWDAFPRPDKPPVFVQPFAKRLAWLLLQEGVLTVFGDQKDVTFQSGGDVELSKIACARIEERVAQLANDKQSDEAKKVYSTYKTNWDLMAAADYALWSWATERLKEAEEKDWDPKKNLRWKLIDGVAIKMA